MASAKDLKKKIRSISNTKKITRTMELVATAKSKRSQARVLATTPYASAIADLLADLAGADPGRHPFLRPPGAGKTAVLVISANRGLCGGYNSNVLALAERALREEEQAGRGVEVYMAGRKGISRFRFRGIALKERFTNLDDKATFQDAEAVAVGLMARYLAGELGKVLVVYTRYISSAVQRPVVVQVLPIEPPKAEATKEGKKARAVDYIYEPEPRRILESLLPLSVKTAIYRAVVEAAASEQLARRLAMKMATDNAEEMISFYKRTYNRTRQAGITQQINEIVSGANALE
jgi:F-type H+-transporting ATPase subunit gamma